MTEAAARREQDRDDLLWFVEQFALLLTEAGMPRMAARVFAYVLAEDADEYTAGRSCHRSPGECCCYLRLDQVSG